MDLRVVDAAESSLPPKNAKDRKNLAPLQGAGDLRMLTRRSTSGYPLWAPPAPRPQIAKLQRQANPDARPLNSGKSTTLAAMIDLINANRSGHIVTIEDPIDERGLAKNLGDTVE